MAGSAVRLSERTTVGWDHGPNNLLVLDRRGHFLAWLDGIARHHASHHFRREGKAVDLDKSLTEGVSAEELAIEHLRAADVIRALDSLAPERAEAPALRLLAGLTPAEVAQVKGKCQVAVRVLVHRALRADNAEGIIAGDGGGDVERLQRASHVRPTVGQRHLPLLRHRGQQLTRALLARCLAR